MNTTRYQQQRRKFLQTSLAVTPALMLGFSIESIAGEKPVFALGADSPESWELTPFIRIDKKGTITLFNPRPEMGQGTYQSMPALLAEELEILPDQVKIESTMGQQKYGNQNAGGSSSVRTLWKPLRTAGAAAREMLITAAAQTWSVPVAECYASNGSVIHRPSGKILPYGELVEKASKLEVPKNPTLKEPQNFTILGKSASRADAPLKVDGSAKFGLDISVPGMLYATIERCPTINGKVVRFNDTAAKKIKGVKHVIKSERPVFGKTLEGVAVLADSYWTALRARKALTVEWETKEFETISSEALSEQMRNLAKTPGVASPHSKGDVQQALGSAGKTLEAQYETPFLAHAPMEPENVVASVKGDKVEIWAPTQGPGWTIGAVARHFKLNRENIIVHPTFLGGAFGRKGGIDDFVLEAVHLSKTVGAPVKLIWSREDDITQGPFRPGALSSMKAGLDAQGNVVAFQHHVITPSIQGQFAPLPKDKVDDWAMEGIDPENSPYSIPNFAARFSAVETSLPVMWWRSVYASTNMFGHECFIDELAHAAGKDPLAFRLALLQGNDPTTRRFINVLNTLADNSGWREPLPAGKGRGIAIARSFQSICAHVVTVGRNKTGKLAVEKVTSVIDCGMHVNTDTVKAQTEGNIIMGLTAALKSPITFKQGRAQQANFDTYQMLRIHETPHIEVYVMPSAEAPGGVGEPGLPPVAPALANAVFAATGKRIRTLPFNMNEV